jgi:hypothetical protein
VRPVGRHRTRRRRRRPRTTPGHRRTPGRRRLARVPTQVLEEQDLPPRGERPAGCASSPTTSSATRPRTPSSSRAAHGDRSPSMSRDQARPLGRPRCEATTTDAPPSIRESEGREDWPDTQVVGDHAVTERGVEVGADQHAPAGRTSRSRSDRTPSGSGRWPSASGPTKMAERPPGGSSSPTRCRTSP